MLLEHATLDELRKRRDRLAVEGRPGGDAEHRGVLEHLRRAALARVLVDEREELLALREAHTGLRNLRLLLEELGVSDHHAEVAELLRTVRREVRITVRRRL